MTLTVNEQVLVLPESSCAVQVTVVNPTENTEPDGGKETKVRFESQTSEATGSGKTTRAEPPSCGNSAAMMLLGQTISGGLVSTIVIVWLHCALLLQASVAV